MPPKRKGTVSSGKGKKAKKQQEPSDPTQAPPPAPTMDEMVSAVTGEVFKTLR